MVLFLAACTSTSEGLCETAKDCLPGLSCQEGVCVGCGGDGECNAWEACTTDRRCELRAGRCTKSAHCEAWETCNADNACVLAASACTSSADCKAHESCDETQKLCLLQEGRCNSNTDCESGYLWAATCDGDNRCHSEPVAGNDVLIWGTLSEGACYRDAIASVLSPSRVQVGFGCGAGRPDATVSPSGRIYYVDDGMGPNRLRVFVPDGFPIKDGARTYPDEGFKNDPVVPTPGCPADVGIRTFVMQAGTGSIIYNCTEDKAGWRYYDSNGAVVTDQQYPVAWNAENYLLIRGDYGTASVQAPDRTTVLPVVGLPDRWAYIDARADSTGFRMALTDSSSTGRQQLWHISNQGQATLVGTYGAYPEHTSYFGGGGGVLDNAGALVAQSSRDVSTVDLVVRRTPDGAPGVIIYAEDESPAKVNWQADYKVNFIFMHGSYLFAGP
ncbi:hypothetical protein ACQKGO_07290 [Corallococcus interemptor]|uniref:hypothetical protein n=1 Tax=Corallococcus interemptor TaxID=2316720 RepID=UPI003D031B0B